MKILFLIGAGSFAGGILRYLLSQHLQTKTSSIFPIGTFAVNITGCFFIGLLIGFFDRGNLATEWRLVLVTGLLGGFTTFSAFSMETVHLLRLGQIGYALSYIVLSVVIGLLATYLAYNWTVAKDL